MQLLSSLVEHLGQIVMENIPYILLCSVLFGVLAFVPHQACNPGKVWWKSKDMITDFIFCFFSGLIGPYLRIFLVFWIALLVNGNADIQSAEAFLSQNHGILHNQPLWVQVLVYVLGTDFLLYWGHRLFHSPRLWAFHAVHHAPEDLDWTATFRIHPVNRIFTSLSVNLLMVYLGVPAEVMIALVPFDMLTAAWVHSNLNWTLGPLKYVIATPVFHRWHHGPPDKGGESNFAPTFAFWDVLFGTFYMPKGELPQDYGVDDPNFPKDFFGQLIVPFVMFFRSFQAKKQP